MTVRLIHYSHPSRQANSFWDPFDFVARNRWDDGSFYVPSAPPPSGFGFEEGFPGFGGYGRGFPGFGGGFGGFGAPFDQFFQGRRRGPNGPRNGAGPGYDVARQTLSNELTRVAEKDGRYEVTTHLDGVDPANVGIEYDEEKGVLTISGSTEREGDDGSYYKASFERSVSVPDPSAIAEDGVTAKVKNGTVRVYLPKVESSIPVGSVQSGETETAAAEETADAVDTTAETQKTVEASAASGAASTAASAASTTTSEGPKRGTVTVEVEEEA